MRWVQENKATANIQVYVLLCDVSYLTEIIAIRDPSYKSLVYCPFAVSQNVLPYFRPYQDKERENLEWEAMLGSDKTEKLKLRTMRHRIC